MPYAQCPRCDLTTYVARSHSRRAECPRCATPLHLPRRRFERSVPADLDGHSVFEDGILHALALARRRLGMDLAFLGELQDDAEVVRWVSGRAESFGLHDALVLPLADSYCSAVLGGDEGVVRDATADERVRSLEITRRARIGSYIGVRIEHEGQVFGLCCLSHDARADLGDEELEFLHGLAETVASTLEAMRASERALSS